MKNHRRIILFAGLYCLTVGLACDPDPAPELNDDGTYHAEVDASDVVDIEVGPAAERPAPAPEELEISNCIEGVEPPQGALVWDFLPTTPALVEALDPTALKLRLDNGVERPVFAEFHVLADDGRGNRYTYEIRDSTVKEGSNVVEVYDLTDTEFDARRMRTSGMISAWVVLTDPETGSVVAEHSAEPVFFHPGSKDQIASSAEMPAEITVYDRHTLEQTYRGGDLLGAIPREVDEGNDVGKTITSRVIDGGRPIVTPGRTNPSALSKLGLLPTDVTDQL